MIVASSECGLWRKNTQWQDKVQEILYREWWLQFIIIHCIIGKNTEWVWGYEENDFYIITII